MVLGIKSLHVHFIELLKLIQTLLNLDVHLERF